MESRAHKIRLAPNNAQTTYFKKACGVKRVAYNWALEEWKKQYDLSLEDDTVKRPNEAALRKRLNACKKEKFPWMSEVTKCAPQQAIRDLGTAFSNFFSGKSKHPTFKKKFIRDSFYLSNDQFRLNEKGDCVKIPNLGWVKLKEQLRFKGKILSATVSRQADRWYVAINVEADNVKINDRKNQAVVGVDFGIKH